MQGIIPKYIRLSKKVINFQKMVQPMKEYWKNFIQATKNYTIMSCDLAGCFIRTETGSKALEEIVGIEAEKFQPVGLDVLEDHMYINEKPKPGEKAGAMTGCFTGLAIDLLSYGTVPIAFLLYDIGASVYKTKKKKQ